jgi:tyrosine-protein kinase Etk/Wzc
LIFGGLLNNTAFDFSAFMDRLVSRWRVIVVNTFLAGIVGFGLTFVMPSWYRSTAVLLPPEETDQITSGVSIQRFLSRMPSLGMMPGYYTPSDIHRAILMSRSAHKAVILQFGLQEEYHQKSLEQTLRVFRRHVSAELNPDGTISVSAEDHSSQRAADITNALVRELDQFNIERRNVQARRARLFFEGRVRQTDSLAKASEAELRRYQEKHRMVVPIDVEGADIGPLADLMARKTTLEVRLATLRSYLREDNENIVQTRTELESLLGRMATMPGVANEVARLVRDVKLYQQVYVILSAQLEDSRLRETMDTPTITLLDAAVPSERRSSPIRRLWAGGAALASALLTAIWPYRKALKRGGAVA